MTKLRLATDMAAPRTVSGDEMERATSEARELRAKLDRATAGMETLTAKDMRIRLRTIGAKEAKRQK